MLGVILLSLAISASDPVGQRWFGYRSPDSYWPLAVVRIEPYDTLLANFPGEPWEVMLTASKTPGSDYQAVRRQGEAFEIVEVSDCDFSASMTQLRELPPERLFVPGVDPADPVPEPPSLSHRGRAITLIALAVRPGEAQTTVTLSADHGVLDQWATGLQATLATCDWKPQPDGRLSH